MIARPDRNLDPIQSRRGRHEALRLVRESRDHYRLEPRHRPGDRRGVCRSRRAGRHLGPQRRTLPGGRDGAIIFIISTAALRASTMLGMYGVTKAADYALCRNLAAEWGPDNIRVNCIAPSVVITQFARVLYEDPARRAAREAATLLRRL